MEFGVDLDQTALDLWQKMTWNVHENACRILHRELSTILNNNIVLQLPFSISFLGSLPGIPNRRIKSSTEFESK